MNMKVLIETLTQIPDLQLLSELSSSIRLNKSLTIPNPVLFYTMLSNLFQCPTPQIRHRTFQLYRDCFSFLLKTELQVSWNYISCSLMRMMGGEDAEFRKKSKELMLQLIQQTNNVNIVLEKLYYEGLEDESVLVMISSGKTIFTILELYPNILHNKTSIRIIKLVLEKMIAMTMSSKHMDLQKSSAQFLHKLFYVKIDRLDQVLIIMNPKILQLLEGMWAKDKERLLQKDPQVENELPSKGDSNIELKYEHLPLINGKFFGVFEPYVIKNIFNPEFQSGKQQAIAHLRQIFEQEPEGLKKYLNIIFKLAIKFIDDQYYDLLMVLKKIVLAPGINNIVNLTSLPSKLVKQMGNQNVPYRRQLRLVLQKLNFQVPTQSLKGYEDQLQNKQSNWIVTFETICLCQHWIDNNMQNSYPPTLDRVLESLCSHMNSTEVKVKQKSIDLLLTILDRYSGYRENLQDHFSPQKINEIEDELDKKRHKAKMSSVSQQAQEIFKREYNQERQRFIQYNKKKKRTK